MIKSENRMDLIGNDKYGLHRLVLLIIRYNGFYLQLDDEVREIVPTVDNGMSRSLLGTLSSTFCGLGKCLVFNVY